MKCRLLNLNFENLVVSTMIEINDLCFIIVGMTIYHLSSQQGIEQNNWNVMR